MTPDEPLPPKKKVDPALISIIVIAVLALGAAGVYTLNNASKSTTDTTTTTSSSASTDSTSDTTTSSSGDASSTTASSTSYKDGTYTEIGRYDTPGGTESITVTATLTSGTISSISVSGSAEGGESEEYQSEFLSGYKFLVIGKSIDSVSLSRVSGSSLTSGGFNSALTKIKTDASA